MEMGQSAARRHEEIRALQHGIELGMNLVDTAEMYDNEELVGEAVRDCREKVFLVSKVLPSNASYRGTKLACERSLLKLGTEYIDLYLLHWKGRHPYEETVRAMTELQQEGKSAYGVSVIWTQPTWNVLFHCPVEAAAPPIRYSTTSATEA